MTNDEIKKVWDNNVTFDLLQDDWHEVLTFARTLLGADQARKDTKAGMEVGLGLLDGGSDYLTFRTQEILNGHDPFPATRRAIVRAAAEVARANQTKVED